MSAAVLVTGGSGFIGTWVLRELLAQGLRPVVIDQQANAARWDRILGDRAKDVTFIAGSLLDQALLTRVRDEFSIAHIIHLAALLTPDCQRDPYLGCQVNVLGSTAIFELARTSAGRIGSLSYASSYAVYGPEADDGSWQGATDKNRPPSFYGAFKLAVDGIAEQYWRHFGIRSAGIRPHVVYGPERTVGLTAGPSLAARAAVEGNAFTIGYRATLGYDYVEDVAKAFVLTAMRTPEGASIMDLPGPQASSEDFVRCIAQAVPSSQGKISVIGESIPANIPPKPHYISQWYPDWKTTSLAEGVAKTVQFYQAT